jgi:hypothetical protein
MLEGWDNFYVIVGGAAAGLTGLTFVVIALAADAHMARLSGLRVFVSPTVIHFASVLWVSALVSVPGHTPLSLGLCMLVSGAIGVVYGARTLWRMWRFEDYDAVAEDWTFNGIMPLLAYLAIAVAGTMIWAHVTVAVYLIGAATLVLLFVGIHNAWDLAVWIIAERPGAQREAEASAAASSPAAAAPQTTSEASDGDAAGD